MKAWLYRILNKVLGKNLDATPVSVILDQMHEPRPLPLGMTEFEEWSDRIISGALISCDVDSQKFACASMLKMMGATEDHKEDVFFIKSLRRSAIQQIADAKLRELKDKSTAKLAAENAARQPVEVVLSSPDLHVVQN